MNLSCFQSLLSVVSAVVVPQMSRKMIVDKYHSFMRIHFYIHNLFLGH